MTSLGDLVREVAAVLRQAGIDSPRREARLLVGAATGSDATRQLAEPDREVPAEPALALASRRAGREPMAYLLGHREFWGIDFLVGPGALVPRPETETLIEAVLQAFPDSSAPLRIADLGTGTGCILFTLLTLYPAATGLGIDRSAAALAWASSNRHRQGLDSRCLLLQADWLEATSGPFDLITANPPYIAANEPRDPETAHEPEAALLAGQDGLDAYRAIIPAAAQKLGARGLLALEIGGTQATAVTHLMQEAGLQGLTLHQDLAGHPRTLTGRKGHKGQMRGK